MVSRRTVLASTAGVLSTQLGGCAAPFRPESTRHYVDVLNSDQTAHVFSVTATGENGEELFEHEYDLEPSSADENRIIDGAPAEVTVLVDDSDRYRVPWAPMEDERFAQNHPDGCSEATSASLSIWYAPQGDDGVTSSFGCETVTGTVREAAREAGRETG